MVFFQCSFATQEVQMSRPRQVRLCFPFILCVAGLACFPACAQLDLTGEWGMRMHEDVPYRGPGPEVGEYLGLPINEAARMKADSWDGAVYTQPERQCIPFAADHSLTVGGMRIWKEVDPATQDVIAWRTHMEYQEQERTIWMDGRPHPPMYAPHTWQGFSTGVWEGDILTVTTTQLKMAQLERNGVPRSDLGTMVEHFIRHDDQLTIVQIVTDPVYLTEPFIRSRNFVFASKQTMGGYPCRPAIEIPNRNRGYVPHHLPGTNPFLNSSTVRFGVPAEAARGGAETIYPEYRLKLQGLTMPRPPISVNLQPPYPQTPDDGGIHVVPVQGSVYMLATPNGNVAVQAGPEAVVLVDTQIAPLSDKILAAIRQISNKPLRYIINTHVHADSTGGNAAIANAGRSIGANNIDGVKILGDSAKIGAAIVAHESVYTRMSTPSGGKAASPFAAWPTETFAAETDELYLNGEAIQIFHEPAAHTDGDSVVFFRRSDVIAAGDVFSTETYPVIDRQNGGGINGIVAALNHLLDLAIPGPHQEGGTYIIPGHGRLCDEADVLEYRDMVTIIRDRIQSMVSQGMTLEQVKAAKPTVDYDPRYGASTGPWTTAMFIEAAYMDLTQSQKK
jgi:glyoxylase-like metal-dependent hydrolase (beta-lactamase superfamily II)